MFGENSEFMGTQFYGGPLFEHRGKPDPAKVKAREEAHKRGLARSKNARRREKEAEERRKEREKKRKQREKELKSMGMSDKDIKKQLERDDRDFEAQEKKYQEQNQLQAGQQFSKEQVRDIDKNHKTALNGATSALKKVEAKTKTEKKLVSDFEDYIDEVNSTVSQCVENGEKLDIRQILDDTAQAYEKQLEESDCDVDDFSDDFDYNPSTKKVTKKKKSKVSDDGNYRDLQDNEAKKNKKVNDLNRQIQELKEKHDKEIDEAKSDAERKRIYRRNHRKLNSLKDELKKMEIKSREDYQEYRNEKRERRKEYFNSNPAVMFFRYHFLKITEPFVKFAGYYNDLYDYTTSNIGG